jgi:hypothetical protein
MLGVTISAIQKDSTLKRYQFTPNLLFVLKSRTKPICLREPDPWLYLSRFHASRGVIASSKKRRNLQLGGVACYLISTVT